MSDGNEMIRGGIRFAPTPSRDEMRAREALVLGGPRLLVVENERLRRRVATLEVRLVRLCEAMSTDWMPKPHYGRAWSGKRRTR